MSEKDTSQILIGYDTLPTDKPCSVATFLEKAFSVATQKKKACTKGPNMDSGDPKNMEAFTEKNSNDPYKIVPQQSITS